MADSIYYPNTTLSEDAKGIMVEADGAYLQYTLQNLLNITEQIRKGSVVPNVEDLYAKFVDLYTDNYIEALTQFTAYYSDMYGVELSVPDICPPPPAPIVPPNISPTNLIQVSKGEAGATLEHSIVGIPAGSTATLATKVGDASVTIAGNTIKCVPTASTAVVTAVVKVSKGGGSTNLTVVFEYTPVPSVEPDPEVEP